MKAERPHYDHRMHAGNAGDVWKHFILAEAANYLLSKKKMLAYAESHVGYPEYDLRIPGEWEGGIGRFWPHISALDAFCYFRIIRDMNPHGLVCYPGSTDLVLQIAGMQGRHIDFEVWDIDPDVAAAWHEDSRVNFHLEDGFTQAQSILDRSPPGMILIDPPYVDENDIMQACNLLRSFEKAGWTVLRWQMAGLETALETRLKKYTLRFSDADLECSRWPGATVAVAGADAHLVRHLDTQVQRFLDLVYS
ncbi:MAG: 23S rRNA (adenine(2030)-N(6))-methyltransferase RlmJ [Methanotrichaceae archaeon]